MSTRRQVTVLLAVLVLLGGGLALRARPQSSADTSELTGLRAVAALSPCPAGGGRELPAVTLPCLGGGPDVPLSAAGTGRPTLVTMWATWCRPCVREVPLLQQFAARAAGRVDVLGVLHEDLPGNALRFARQTGMHYPSVVDSDGGVLRSFGSGPPITVLLSADGKVMHVRRGEFTDLAQVTSLVADTLGVTVDGR